MIGGLLGGVLVLGGAIYFWKKMKKTNEPVSEKRVQKTVPSNPIEKHHLEELGDPNNSNPSNITEAQMNILRAANHNEGVVLRVILKHNGQVKRNMLEKETKLPKSSLASSLHNLEKKNIIEIDRTF